MTVTKERLAVELEKHGLTDLAKRARRGRYDDYESESDTPTVDLVRILIERGHPDLAQRAKDGEWDGTEEEGNAWMAKEGAAALGVKTVGEAYAMMDRIHQEAGAPDIAEVVKRVVDPYPIRRSKPS